ncbi:hypothetical protein Tco_1260994, partial [Tanacetum coccineum]
ELEKDVFELKKIDHSAEALATLKSQVSMIVEHYLGSKIIDDLQKKLTIDLEQESEKSTSYIHKIKRERTEKQKMLKYTIKSTDKATLNEYDHKSTLYQTMHENKSFNRNPANHALYHALMEALIEDENAMDKGVADTVKNYKRQHDDDDDDDEDPSAGPKQAPSKSSKTSKSATAKEPIEEPTAEVEMDVAVNTAAKDVVHDANQPQNDYTQAKDKAPMQDWFKQPPGPPTLDPEWNKRQVVIDQPEQPWLNQMVSAAKDPLTFDDLMATLIDFSKYVLNRLQIDHLTQEILVGLAYNLLKGRCSSSIELEYNVEECFKALTDRLDWNNPEGDHFPFDLTKPLPLKGRPGHLTVVAEYFFNNDLEFLKSSDLEKKYTSLSRRQKQLGIKHWGERRKLWYRSQVKKKSKHNVYFTLKILGVKSVSVKKLHRYGHLEEIVVKRANRQLYKFKEGNFVDLHLNDIEDMLLLIVQHKLFHLELTLLWLFVCSQEVLSSKDVSRIYNLV